MTADAVGFQAAWATSDCELRRSSWCVLRAIGQILKGLLLQREFCQIGFHVGSLIQSGRWNGPKHILHSHTTAETRHAERDRSADSHICPWRGQASCLMRVHKLSSVPGTANKNRRHTARQLKS